MKNNLRVMAIVIIIVGSCDAVRAAEISLIAPGGIRAAVDQMIPAFEKATGHNVKATFGSGGGTKERVIKGETFDVPHRAVAVRARDHVGSRGCRE
jgi:ABC-type molybdate transport system substrate-binding protein